MTDNSAKNVNFREIKKNYPPLDSKKVISTHKKKEKVTLKKLFNLDKVDLDAKKIILNEIFYISRELYWRLKINILKKL